MLLLLQKADKRTLDNLINRTKFDQSIGSLDQSLQELLHRLEGQVCNSCFDTMQSYLMPREIAYKLVITSVAIDLNAAKRMPLLTTVYHDLNFAYILVLKV